VDDNVPDVKSICVGVGFGVLEETKEEVYGLLGSATLSDLQSIRRPKARMYLS